MNTKQNVAKVAMVAVVLMAAALMPSVANAQAVQGTFTLPCTTYWENNVLPAGRYTITVSDASMHAKFIKLSGPAKAQFFALARNETPTNESSLTLATSNGVAVVRSLYLGRIGRSIPVQEGNASKEMLSSVLPSSIQVTKVMIAAGE